MGEKAVPASGGAAACAERMQRFMDEVDAFCRCLIENAGKGGRLILDCGIGIPDESKPENVRAMFAAARKYNP